MQGNWAYFWLFMAWGLYFFIHSYMASTGFKNYFSKKLKMKLQTQRLIYSVISSVGLLLLLLLNGAIQSKHIIPVTQELKIISMLLSGAGILVVKAGFKHYDMKAFLGLVSEQSDLEVSGILSKVRHPIYSGTILITLGFFLFDPRFSTLVSVSAIFAYLPIGIRLEEKKLIDQFGGKYLEYRERVPMLVPKISLFNS